jgi:hypothetical protein
MLAATLVVALAVVLAASAFAAPRNPAARNPFQPLVTELNGINFMVVMVLDNPPRGYFANFLSELDAWELNALADEADQVENQLETMLATEPVPPSAQVTTEVLAVLAAAEAIVQDVQEALAADPPGEWSASFVDALTTVEDSAQGTVNVVQDFTGFLPT